MKKKITCLFLTLVMVLSLVACGGGDKGGSSEPAGNGGSDAPATEESATPTVLRLARGEDVTTWDPYNNTGIPLIMLCKLLYGHLVEMTADGEIIGDLATEWSANEDATAWTFKLREGVTFSDGTPFNAEAVKISLERFMNETLSNGNLWTTFTGVDVVGDYECVLNFSEANGAVLNNLCETPMLNPKVIQEEGVDGLAKAIGTGPYTLESWEMGSKITMKKNPTYWGEAPVYETIEYYVIQEDATRLAAVQTGQVDIADSLPADLVMTVEGDPNVQIHRINTQDLMFLGLKCDQYPFDDVNARKAVMYGINRQSLVDNVMLGGSAEVRCMLAEGMMGYSDEFPVIEYDLELAKEYLAKSDYKGDTLEFIAPIGWYAKQSEQCQAIIADLKAVGFDVELTMLEGATFSTTRNSGHYDIYTTGCAHPCNDPNLFLSQRVKGDSAMSGYKNDELMALIEAGYQANSTEGRQEAYEQVMQIMTDEVAPQLPLYCMEQVYAVSSKIDLEASADTFRTDKRIDLRWVVFK